MPARTSSDDTTSSRFERWPAILGLTYGIVGGPMSALLMQAMAYNGVNWACGHRNIAVVHIIPAIFLTLAVLAGGIAYRDWVSVGRIGRAEGATITDRTRFAAVSGMVSSAFGILLILAMWIPLVVFDPCQH